MWIFLRSHPAGFDCSEKRWRNWSSYSECQDAAFLPLGLPAQVISCDCCCIHGNEPLQVPSTPAPLTGWLACMDDAWAMVLSAPGVGSSSPLQKTQLAVYPPSHHAHACWIPHDWTRPPGAADHAQGMPAPEYLSESRAMMVSFEICNQKTFSRTCGPVLKMDNISCHHISGLSGWALFFSTSFAAFKSCQLTKKDFMYEPISRHFCPLFWFFAASLPALQPR